jgi:hypothetical protein
MGMGIKPNGKGILKQAVKKGKQIEEERVAAPLAVEDKMAKIARLTSEVECLKESTEASRLPSKDTEAAAGEIQVFWAALQAKSASALYDHVPTAKRGEVLSQENDRAQKFVKGFKETLETANNNALSSHEELEFRTAQFAADKKALEVQLAERFAESAAVHDQITRLTADVEEAFEADVTALRLAGEAAAAASAKVILRLTSEVGHLRGSSGREAVALVDMLESEVENGKRLGGLISHHLAAKAGAEEEVKSYKEKLRKAIDMGKGFKADDTGNKETAARLVAELVALRKQHAESATAKDVVLEQQTDGEKEAAGATTATAATAFATAAAIAAAADTEKKTDNSHVQVAAYKEKLRKAIEMGKSIEAEKKEARATVAEREAEIARLTAAAEAEAGASEASAAAALADAGECAIAAAEEVRCEPSPLSPPS